MNHDVDDEDLVLMMVSYYEDTLVVANVMKMSLMLMMMVKWSLYRPLA